MIRGGEWCNKSYFWLWGFLLVHGERMTRRHFRNFFLVLLALIALPALLFPMILIRTFLYQPFSIPSGAMAPTLVVGDYLFV